MGFGFVALAAVEQSFELAAGGPEFANAVVEGGSVLPFGTEIA